MKTLIGASKLFCCDKNFTIITNGGVLFESDPSKKDNKILCFGTYADLAKKYPKVSKNFHAQSIMLPALSNPHIHLEFSNHKTQFAYGDFGEWLESVIQKREELFENVAQSIENEIKLQLQSGISSIGAISSYGFDIAPLGTSPLRVQLFNEAIGSNPALLDTLYSNLLARVEECKKYTNPYFHPALSIHSPYSTHKTLASKVSQLAKENNMLLSVHFLESHHELQWLTHSDGFFRDFFAKYFGNKHAIPSMNVADFLTMLKDNRSLFVHCLFASQEDLNKIASMDAKVISSPRSNRLLNNCYLNLDYLKNSNLPTILSTDGLSSNFSLSLLDEMRHTLFAYPQYNPNEFAKELILGVTHYANQALCFNGGEIAQGKDADLALFGCEKITQSHQEALHFVLHSQKAKQVYINGIGEYHE